MIIIGDPSKHRYDSESNAGGVDLNPRPSDYKSDALPLSYASTTQTEGEYQRGTPIARLASRRPAASNSTPQRFLLENILYNKGWRGQADISMDPDAPNRRWREAEGSETISAGALGANISREDFCLWK